MRRTITICLLGVAAFTSCGPAHPPQADPAAQVSKEQASRARAIVFGVDYLPFDYVRDGCYARAYYLAMELAAAGIPSSIQYAQGDLRPSPGVQWKYHAAVMVWPRDRDEPVIFDPAVSSAPLARSDWVRRLGAKESVTLAWAVGTNLVFNGAVETTGPHRRLQIPDSLKELGQFSVMDVSTACRYMGSYLSHEPNVSAEEQRKKRTRLLRRTYELKGLLEERNLYPRDPGEPTGSCY